MIPGRGQGMSVRSPGGKARGLPQTWVDGQWDGGAGAGRGGGGALGGTHISPSPKPDPKSTGRLWRASSDLICSVFQEGPAGRKDQWADTLGDSHWSWAEGLALESEDVFGSRQGFSGSRDPEAREPQSPWRRVTQRGWRAGFEGWEGP